MSLRTLNRGAAALAFVVAWCAIVPYMACSKFIEECACTTFVLNMSVCCVCDFSVSRGATAPVHWCFPQLFEALFCTFTFIALPYAVLQPLCHISLFLVAFSKLARNFGFRSTCLLNTTNMLCVEVL